MKRGGQRKVLDFYAISPCRNGCDKVSDRSVRVALREFSSWQYMEKIGDKVSDKVRALCRRHKNHASPCTL